MKQAFPLLGLAALCLAPAAFAAGTAELAITATVRPHPCTLSIANGGTFDFQAIRASTLRADKYTDLEARSSTMSISCPASMKFAVRVLNNRISDATAGTPLAYGLGRAGNADIGVFHIDFIGHTLKADGYPARLLYRERGRWQPGYSSRGASPEREFSWNSQYDVHSPQAFRRISIDLEVQPSIAPTKRLPITSAIELDGSATLELKYL